MMVAPTEQAFLAVRDRLRLNPIQYIRLSFEPESEDAPNSPLVAVMRCAACDAEFVWQGGWWECSSCGIELTPWEVADLIEAAKQALKTMSTDKRMKRG